LKIFSKTINIIFETREIETCAYSAPMRFACSNISL